MACLSATFINSCLRRIKLKGCDKTRHLEILKMAVDKSSNAELIKKNKQVSVDQEVRKRGVAGIEHTLINPVNGITLTHVSGKQYNNKILRLDKKIQRETLKHSHTITYFSYLIKYVSYMAVREDTDKASALLSTSCCSLYLQNKHISVNLRMPFL